MCPSLKKFYQASKLGCIDPAPPGHGEYVECRVWRVFIRLNGVTLLYAFGINGDAIGVDNSSFRIHNFISHLPIGKGGPGRASREVWGASELVS